MKSNPLFKLTKAELVAICEQTSTKLATCHDQLHAMRGQLSVMTANCESMELRLRETTVRERVVTTTTTVVERLATAREIAMRTGKTVKV